MRKFVLAGAVAALMASAATADYSVPVPDLELAALESFTLDVNIIGGSFSGFDFSMDYGEPIEDFSWASDLAIFVTTPGGTTYQIGGLSGEDIPWAFQGSGSDAPGFYSDTVDFTPIGGPFTETGLWTFTFENNSSFDSNPNPYSNIFFNLIGVEVPAPGALALLGVAGLAGQRRRRA